MLKNKKISRTVSVGWLEVFQLMHVQEEKRLVQFLRSNGTTVWQDGESSENDVQLTPGDRYLRILKPILTQIKQC